MSDDVPFDDRQAPVPPDAGARSVHVFLNDSVDSAGFDETVGRLVDAAVRRTGGGAAAVGGCFPLAKSFALDAEASVIAALSDLDAVKSIASDAGDFFLPPASRRTLD